MNDLTRFGSFGEARVARRLIRAALADGFTVSVNDGYETVVTRATSERKIFDAMCSTGEDVITIHMPSSGKACGNFWLIYGNDESGEELISDHTDNEHCNRLAALAYASRAEA